MIFERVDDVYGSAVRGVSETGKVWWIPDEETNVLYRLYLEALETF
jgi:hypothetical protein